MERKIVGLTEVGTSEIVESIKEGRLEVLENEIAILESEIKLPPIFMQLEEQAQQMILLYLEEDFVEEISKSPTKGNVFACFLATYKNKKLLKDIFIKKVEYDLAPDGSQVAREVTVVNPSKMTEYLKLKSYAMSYWTRNNLKDIIKPIRDVIVNGGFRDEEILEREILDDAKSRDKSVHTRSMRSLAVKIKGMEKNNALQQINVYVDSGGKQLNDKLIKTSGNDTYDLGIIEGDILE